MFSCVSAGRSITKLFPRKSTTTSTISCGPCSASSTMVSWESPGRALVVLPAAALPPAAYQHIIPFFRTQCHRNDGSRSTTKLQNHHQRQQLWCCTNTPRHVVGYYRSAGLLFNSSTTRFISSFSTISSINPPDAGKKAYEERCKSDSAVTKEEMSLHRGSIGTTLSMDTMLAHAGLMISPQSDMNQPLSPPLHLESTYTRPPSGDYFDESDGGRGWIYSRIGNPTRTLLEETLSELEFPSQDYKDLDDGQSESDENEFYGRLHGDVGKEKAATCAFSSGMAAAAAVILAFPQPLHIIIPDDVYHGVPSQLKTVFQHQRDLTYSSVDMTVDGGAKIMEEIDEIITRNRCHQSSRERNQRPVGHILVWMESPSNPLCKVIDIKRVCDLISQRQEEQSMQDVTAIAPGSTSTVTTNSSVTITTLVDSTWAPPCLTQPLVLGADIVLHSGTKYLGGHSDVLLGAVTTSPCTHMGKWLGGSTPSSTSPSRLRSIQISLGSTASPLDCWLTLRGLRTLHLRVERQCDNALKLARWLASESSSTKSVMKVHYPGLIDHPQHQIAKRQMRSGYFGGMFSFEMENEAMAMAVAGAVSTIKRATSLGGKALSFPVCFNTTNLLYFYI